MAGSGGVSVRLPTAQDHVPVGLMGHMMRGESPHIFGDDDDGNYPPLAPPVPPQRVEVTVTGLGRDTDAGAARPGVPRCYHEVNKGVCTRPGCRFLHLNHDMAPPGAWAGGGARSQGALWEPGEPADGGTGVSGAAALLAEARPEPGDVSPRAL